MGHYKWSIKTGRYTLFIGDKFIGLLVSETYDSWIVGLHFWNWGIFIIRTYEGEVGHD